MKYPSERSRFSTGFRFGIYAETPEAIVELINQFRFGSDSQKLAALREMLQFGEYQRVMDLVDIETDQSRRQQTAANVLKSFDGLIPEWLVERRLELVQQGARLGVCQRSFRAADPGLCGPLVSVGHGPGSGRPATEG